MRELVGCGVGFEEMELQWLHALLKERKAANKLKYHGLKNLGAS